MIDIIMPLYTNDYSKLDEDKYITQCLNSMAYQTIKDIRLIIVNDKCRTSGLRKVKKCLKEYKLDHLIIDNAINMGLTKSMNIGLQYCESELIARQDFDDYSLPQRFEKQRDCLHANAGYGAVGCFYINITDKDTIYHISNPQPLRLEVHQLAGTIAGGCLMMRRELAVKLGGWSQRFAQDFEMNVKIRQNGFSLYNVEDYLYVRRVHDGQISKVHKQEQSECHRNIKSPLTAVNVK